jgi:hypothetical protein
MALDVSQYLQFTSRNAAKLARKLGDFEGNPEFLASTAADIIYDRARGVLMSRLESAISQAPAEFQYPAMAEQLIHVFSDPDMLTFTRNGVQLERNAKRIAGNDAHLRAGITAAREELNLGKLPPDAALRFWRERIYRPARQGLQRPRSFKKNVGRGKQKPGAPFDYVGYATTAYAKTINERLKSWGDLAPYWIWLDKGSGGYPPSNGTNFITHAKAEINALYQNALVEVAEEFSVTINAEVTAFLLNPDTYEPGQFLAEFEFAGARFKLGVTPGGDLSIRRQD